MVSVGIVRATTLACSPRGGVNIITLSSTSCVVVWIDMVIYMGLFGSSHFAVVKVSCVSLPLVSRCYCPAIRHNRIIYKIHKWLRMVAERGSFR